jgi:hypothetical protein
MSERVTVREFSIGPDRWVVDAEFAHRLADELAEAKERIEQLEGLLAGEKWISEDAKALAEVIRIVEAKP